MSKVTSIDSAKPDPHISGEQICLACGHTQVCVAPTGVTPLECGNCGAMKAVWKHFIDAEEGVRRWQCSCEGVLFVLTQTSVVCASCGQEQMFS